MKTFVAILSGVLAVMLLTGTAVESRTPIGASDTLSSVAVNEVVTRYCVNCHSERMKTGNMILEGYTLDSAVAKLSTTEKMIRKLRTQMMPPPGARRPAGDTLLALVATLENKVDSDLRPNPGVRVFQRLNRPEYELAIRDLVGLKVDAGNWLPLDTKSANFDNIADVQMPSATSLSAYLNAATAISRAAVGDRNAALETTVYVNTLFNSQHPWNRVEGAPYGTRGGIVVEHIFPADGLYSFRMNVTGPTQGSSRQESIDISVDGERVTLTHYERGIERSINSADATLGADFIRSVPVMIKAGQHRISAAFVRRTEGPYEDLIKPHDWSRAGNGSASTGTTELPHMTELAVVGPTQVTGLSETESRKMIFTCRPTAPARERPCAQEIVTRLATRAYRRPVDERDVSGLMRFYDEGSKNGNFEDGVRMALQAILASPHFVFKFEDATGSVNADGYARLSDLDLASRLSFFLWGSIPDEELLDLARRGRLSQPRELERQVRRMMADPKVIALGDRFAAQWLRLQDIDKVRPDAFWFPDFDQQLMDAMKTESKMFFNDLVENDRSVLNFFNADYTFVNEALAKHYGIPNVSGKEFRRVSYPDETRRGLLGHGSVLVQTSMANRTSPVLRGKWVMEVLIGAPPPPPPPDVPDLEETEASTGGKTLTTRERMEIHRRNATCRTCHQYIDPMGLALDRFDVTGKWRERENGVPLDTQGNLYDGTRVSSPKELGDALMKRPIPLVRAFTENLMAYALGRRVEDFDQPSVRAIAKEAEATGYRMSSFIMGIVKSNAFLNRKVDIASEGQTGSQP
jgi:hypothetical protein